MLFLKPKSIVDKDQEDWIRDQYDWLIENVGFPNKSEPLILPTHDYFTTPPKGGHNKAEHIFNDVKKENLKLISNLIQQPV